MYQPITPVIPFEPMTRTEPSLMYGFAAFVSVLSQSSRATSTLPSRMAWKYGGPSVTCVSFTVHPSRFSSTYFATYVFAVDPAHDCSLITTVPQLCVLPPNALPDTLSAAIATSASPSRPTPPLQPRR